MKILRDWQAKHQAKKETKKQALRLKNAKLRAAGKEPLKGWGKMVDTGIAGRTKQTPSIQKCFWGKIKSGSQMKRNGTNNKENLCNSSFVGLLQRLF